MPRWLWMIGLAILVVLVVVARFVVSIDTLVAREIERIGSEVTGVPVRVGEVELALREGRGTIRGLSVANPEGFQPRPAFALGEVTLVIDLTSLETADPIVLSEIRIVAPEVDAEINAAGRSNLDVILENVRAAGAEDPAEPTDDAEAPTTNLAISRFVIESGALRGDASALTGASRDAFETDLPPVRLRDVGGADGAPPEVVAEILLTAFVQQTVRSVAAWQARDNVERSLGGGELGKEAGRIVERILN